MLPYHRLIHSLLHLVDEELSKVLNTPSISDTRYNNIRRLKVLLLNISSELDREFAWIREETKL